MKKYISGLANPKTANEEEHSIVFTISSDAIDRHGEIVDQVALKNGLTAFKSNPVALAGHQHILADGRSPVIGRWDVSTFRQKNGKSEMKLIFDTDTELGEQYWRLYKNSSQKAVSVGFIGKRFEARMVDNKSVRVCTELELIEISCVPVPANPDAIAKADRRRMDFVDDKRSGGLGDVIGEIKAAYPDMSRSEALQLAQLLRDDNKRFADFEAENLEFARQLLGVSDAVEKGRDCGNESCNENKVDFSALVWGTA